MDELNLQDYIAVLRRRRGVVIASILAAVGLALTAALVKTPQYKAEAELLLRRSDSQAILVDEMGQVRSAADAERELNNEIRLIESRRARDAVDAVYDGPLDVDDVKATAPTSDANDQIELSVISTDPAEATRLVNDYARTYMTERRNWQLEDLTVSSEQIQSRLDQLQEQIAEVNAPADELDARIAALPSDSDRRAELEEEHMTVLRTVLPQLSPLLSRESSLRGQLLQLEVTRDLAGTGGIELLAEATEPDTPVSPNTVRYLVVATIMGLLGGVALACLIDHLDDSVRTKEEGERLTGLPTLGMIPRSTDRRRQSVDVVTLQEPASLAAEAFRSLRTSVKFLGVDRPVKTILVTSAATSEGKTVTAANLAVTLAQAGEEVVLVGGDLRRPRVHQLFGVRLRPGLTNLLLGDADLDSALHRLDDPPTLQVLPAGPLPPNPAELLDGPRARQLFEMLAASFDTVVIDSPPVLPVTDAQVLARFADVSLFVVSYRETSKRGLVRALELLGQVDAPVVGTVLNLVPAEQAYGGQPYRYAYYGRGERRRDRAERGVEPARPLEWSSVDGNGSSGDGATWSPESASPSAVADEPPTGPAD